MNFLKKTETIEKSEQKLSLVVSLKYNFQTNVRSYGDSLSEIQTNFRLLYFLLIVVLFRFF